MMDHQLTVAQWIDRCGMRFWQLLPALDPADVARNATKVRGGAR